MAGAGLQKKSEKMTVESTNRTGRPFGEVGIRVRAKPFVADAIAALADVAKNAADPMARVEAAKAIIHVAVGKPKRA